MAKTPKVSQPTDKDRLEAGFYKGYDIKWLRENPDHADYELVKEYDNLVKENK